MHTFCEYGEIAKLQSMVESIDLESVFDSAYQLCTSDETSTDVLRKIVDILNYIENETSIPTTVSDTTYDKILELVISRGDNNAIGTSSNMTTQDESVREHQYPELRGSLQKVHFASTDEIPDKDSRKSLEDFLKNTLSDYIIPEQGIITFVDYKWDGTSNVFECNGTNIEHVLTRYKVELNLGKDVTHVYKGKTAKDIFQYKIPGQFYDMGNYGVKVEVIMPNDKFEQYKEYIKDNKCNRRSAVSGITTKTDENIDPIFLEFLEVIPLQISTEEPIEGNPDTITVDDRTWLHAGIIDGRHQYIAIYYSEGNMAPVPITITNKNYQSIAKSIYAYRDLIEKHAENRGYPIDGMVITLWEWDLIQSLGREHHKNKFQTAFKFPAGIMKTTIEDVIFQVGPIAGTITPVAVVKPIVMNGNTITHVGLSNMEKLERLNLHIGDEIKVLYDIIPKIIVDDTCKKVDGEQILPITECPVCHGELDSGRCVNVGCDAKLTGRIAGFTKKMNIPGFGIETISDLVNHKIITSIADLYKLNTKISDMLNMPGYQETSVKNLINAPLSKTNVYVHELLGSIGIPDISLSTMEKVCRHIPLSTLLNEPDVLLSMYHSINGLGEITASKIIIGIEQNKELISQLIPWFSFKEYTDEPENEQIIIFTKIRDEKFSEFLQTLGIMTSNEYKSKAIALVVPDGEPITSTKKDKAIKNGIPILTISEAKKKWNYEG